MEKPTSNIPIRKIPRKFVPLVAVMIALLTVSVITAGAYKLNLFSFLRIPSTTWTEYGSKDAFGQVFHFGYIPDGFVESVYEVKEDNVQIFYVDSTDKNRYFSLTVYRNTQRLLADTENTEFIDSVSVRRKQPLQVHRKQPISVQ